MACDCPRPSLVLPAVVATVLAEAMDVAQADEGVTILHNAPVARRVVDALSDLGMVVVWEW